MTVYSTWKAEEAVPKINPSGKSSLLIVSEFTERLIRKKRIRVTTMVKGFRQHRRRYLKRVSDRFEGYYMEERIVCYLSFKGEE